MKNRCADGGRGRTGGRGANGRRDGGWSSTAVLNGISPPGRLFRVSETRKLEGWVTVVAAIQTVRCESESYSGKALQQKFLGESFNLVRTSWSFPEYCEPILQMPMSPANVGFSRRTPAAAKKCRFENRFLGKLAEK